MSAPPIVYEWTGEGHVPLPRFRAEADAHFVVGQRYRMIEHEDRSQRSHNHFFANVGEAWKNLDEQHLDRFPTPEHLRKAALIAKGHFDRTEFVASSKAEALRLAAFLRGLDEYAVIVVREAVVARLVAKSMSRRAMGKEFKQAKDDVLDYCAQILGVTPEALMRNTREVC